MLMAVSECSPHMLPGKSPERRTSLARPHHCTEENRSTPSLPLRSGPASVPGRFVRSLPKVRRLCLALVGLDLSGVFHKTLPEQRICYGG